MIQQSKKSNDGKPPRGKPVKIPLTFDDAVDALVRVPPPDKGQKPPKRGKGKGHA